METIFKGKLLALREADFITYVFENQEDNTIAMITRLPNWQSPRIEIGDVGFVKVDDIKAGESYIDRFGKTRIYASNSKFFIDFIPIKEQATTMFKL